MIVTPCVMSPGGFSGEISFEIEVLGKPHVGVASRRYFYKENWEPLGKCEVTDKLPGFIAVRILEEEKENSFLVSVPDGEVVRVSKDKICNVGRAANVPVRS
jgi:hypothetical protein